VPLEFRVSNISSLKDSGGGGTTLAFFFFDELIALATINIAKAMTTNHTLSE
jgi:hypothetical protein